MHVHVAPDVIERRLSDLDLASEFLTHGLRGFVLKSHYVPTAERAAVVRQVRPGLEAVGSITLNHAVGGLNPAALEISARLGARVVWMPTVDAANEWTARPVNAPPPAWGAVVLVMLPQWSNDIAQDFSLSNDVQSNLPLALYGIVLMAVIVAAPEGSRTPSSPAST